MFGLGKKSGQKEPEYVASPLNTPMLNYKVYVMGRLESDVEKLADRFGEPFKSPNGSWNAVSTWTNSPVRNVS